MARVVLYGEMKTMRKVHNHKGAQAMTRKNAILIAVAALVICMAGGLAYAGRGHAAWQDAGLKNRKGFGACQTLYKGLSPEKQIIVDGLRNEHREKIFGLRRDVQAKRATLKALLLAPDADKTKINESVKELNQARGKMLEERVAHRLKMAEETGMRIPMGRGFRRGRVCGAMCGVGRAPDQRLKN